jgi:NDP-sugar pyrophosphorylase family protein
VNRLANPPQVVLAAGGKGTRLGRLTQGTQKCLLPVGGKPFLACVIESYARQGIREFVVCSGHLADAVVEAIGDGSRWGVAVRHSVEPRPVGVAAGLRHAAALLADAFVLSYGDVYHRVPCARLLERFRTVTQPALMSVLPDDSGNATVADGRVTVYQKGTPPGTHRWLDAGQLVLSSSVLGSEAGEAELFSRLARSGQLAALPIAPCERPYDIGHLTGYQEFCAAAASGAP